MSSTISIPPGWQYPQFTFGQRTEHGQIIGMRYYEQNTFLASEYGEGWRYNLLPNKNTEDEEHRTEDKIILLSPQKLKTTLEAKINSYLRQIESLKHQLESISGSVLTANSTTKTEPVSLTQYQSTISPPALHKLIDGAKLFIQEIAKHPDYLALDYQPDLTIGDADTALSYLELELESNKNSN